MFLANIFKKRLEFNKKNISSRNKIFRYSIAGHIILHTYIHVLHYYSTALIVKNTYCDMKNVDNVLTWSALLIHVHAFEDHNSV